MNISDQAFFFEPEDKLAELIGSRLDGNATLALVSSTVRAFFDNYATHSPRGELNPANLRGGSIETHKGCQSLASAKKSSVAPGGLL